MRVHEFACDCGGSQFITSTDNLSYMAHYVPDQEFDAFSDAVDAAIEKSGPTPRDKDAACMAWRNHPLLCIWQCYACGSVFIQARDGTIHRFVPASDAVPKQLFKRR